MVVSGLALTGLHASGSVSEPQVARSASTGGSDESTIMQDAMAALAAGQGPAGGSTMTCAQAGGGYSCSSGPERAPLATPELGGGGGLGVPGLFPYNATPSPRYGAALSAFGDPTALGDLSAVLFGGADAFGRVYNDTWEYEARNASWWNVTPYLQCNATSCPSARHDASAMIDIESGANDEVVLFGGCTVSAPEYTQSTPGCDTSSSHILGDTWTYSDTTGYWGNWTQLSPSSPPPPRYGAAIAEAPTSIGEALILFGGCGVGTHCPLNDTWGFSLGAWTNRTLTHSPPARYGAAMGVLKITSGLIDALFGGCGTADAGCLSGGVSDALDDTWTYDGSAWTQQIASASCSTGTVCPAPRYYAGYTSDFATGSLEVVGGAGAGGIVLGPESDSGGFWDLSVGTSSLVWAVYSTPQGTGTGGIAAWDGPDPLGPLADRYDPMLMSQDGYGILLFGGSSPTGSTLGDTWFYGVLRSAPTVSGLGWPPPLPSPEYGGSIADDSADGYDVQFGGCGAQCGNATTWTFASGRFGPTGTNMPWESLWPTLNPSNSPVTRFNASMVYFDKSSSPVVILFGGIAGDGTLLGDTWEFTGGSWTPLSFTGSTPSPRQGAAFAFNDSVGSQYAVLFGGCGATCPLGDTWTLTFVSSFSWTLVTPTSSPSARWGAAMAYDPWNARIVLFGGCGSTCPLGDTWFYSDSLLTWTQCTSSGLGCSGSVAPPARWGAAIATDSADGFVVMFGGMGASGVLQDTYISGDFPGARVWYAPTLLSSPAGRYGGSLADDPRDGYVVLTGGANATGEPIGGFGWLFHKNHSPAIGYSWTSGPAIPNEIPAATAPSARYGGSLAYNSSGDYVLLFGGCQDTGIGACGPLSGSNDTWEFVNGSWRLACTDCGPSPRWDAGLAFDPVDDYFLLVGGCVSSRVTCNSSTVLNDSWTFGAHRWTARGSLPFSARGDMSMAWDAHDLEVIVFGGVGCGSACGDTWRYVSGTWHHVGGAGPSARAGAAFAYDALSSDRYMLLFGGQRSTGTMLSDTWRFTVGGGWVSVTGGSSPSARRDGAMAFDGLDGYVLLVGGEDAGAPVSDAWSFAAGSWSSSVTVLPSGQARWGMGLVFDAAVGPNGFTLLFGGSNGSAYSAGGPPVVGGSSPAQGNTWEYLGTAVPTAAPAWQDVSMFA
ncbi:MAG TPA: kelch repeat-containing protein [Thermoplasmata archaeon]|nr:kelch repeat-containing protein [Thermoplasmata archaeon]